MSSRIWIMQNVPLMQIFIYYTLWSKHLPKIILNKNKAGRIFTEVYQECQFTQEDFLVGFAESIVRNLTPVLFIYLFLVLPLYCYQSISLHPRAHMLSHVTPWTAACQAPPSMDFSRQEYWSGLQFPSSWLQF